MGWNERYPKGVQPTQEQIDSFVSSELWEELHEYLREAYGVSPLIQYSSCTGAPGWNIKYRKSGRALCTLYPDEGTFICLVAVGGKEEMEAELVLNGCTDYVRELYRSSQPSPMGRWLMIRVASPQILTDVKALIATRVKPGAGRKKK